MAEIDYRSPEDVEHELRYYVHLHVECESDAVRQAVLSVLQTWIQNNLPDGSVGEKILKRIEKTVNQYEEGDEFILSIVARIGWRTGLNLFDHEIARQKREDFMDAVRNYNKTGISSIEICTHLCPHRSTVPLGRCVDRVVYSYP